MITWIEKRAASFHCKKTNQNGWFWWSSIQLNQVFNQRWSQTEILAGLVPITAPKPLPKALPRYPYLRNVEKNCGREREREKQKLKTTWEKPLTLPWLRAGLCSRQKTTSVQQASLLANAMLDLRIRFKQNGKDVEVRWGQNSRGVKYNYEKKA